jgi:glycosyltransferase involved in cell wall biosynthesis
VQALPKIIKAIPKFKALFIVSESLNNKADEVRAFIEKHHLGKHIVRIPGVKYTTLGNYILASDVVIVPSLVEGFGFSAAETCALGQQLVATNAAALTEVVSGRVNFAEPANAEAIAQGVIDFHQGKYEVISERRFTWKANIEKTLALYEKLLKKG